MALHRLVTFQQNASSFVIAPLVEDEIEPFLRLAHGFLKKPIHVGIADVESFVSQTVETAELLMNDPNTHIFVARSTKEMLGYISINVHPALHVNGIECMIRELFVREGAQSNGIGTALVAYVENFAREHLVKRISLATNWDHDDQQRFYEKLGFQRRCDFVIKYLDSKNNPF